ncbi:hypothetical protein BCON_0468g00020 [Botryotinia convoluta]|uniref:Uncharacterized protein n=1 Tax=Botryotinia convoluta TaxID=54673 RepID=A0A4Z1HDJ8_9HELO|nr:hypothetical protein BCON_0468g00020 [Botryotinia convoluta]
MSTTSLDLSLGLGEPIICLNTSCNYPFGRVCSECSNELESRAQAQAQSKTKPDYKNRNPKVQPALSRSTTVQSRSLDIPTRVADIVEDLQGIFAFVPVPVPAPPAPPVPAPAVPQKPSKLTIQNLQILDSTPLPLSLLPFPKPHSTSSSENTSTGNNPHPSDNQIFDFWLNDIVLRTLEGQVLSPSFTGGAHEEDELEAMCPYCDSSMGEGAWRELHLINCRYACVEAERLEIAMAKRGD